jgi:ABC-type multidrug transport system fused ATPase/permease subunit
MSGTTNVNEELFDGGPPLHLERSLGLIKPGRPLVAKHALLAVLVGWLPLAVLAATQRLLSSDESAKTFFSDIAVLARSLVAVPALTFAEAECIPRLGKIVNHFAETGLVVGPDTARFQAAVSSTRRLLDSTIGDVVTLVLAYLVVAALALYFSTDVLPAWHRRQSTSVMGLSPAGWWHALVSLPLLLVLFFGWLWRLALWARFLFLMSQLDLHLIPGHPDRVGGLKFVASSLRGFRLISFAVGAIVAGSIANSQVHRGTQFLEFKNLVIGLLIFLLILFAGPLTIFLNKLRETKRRGVFEYGALAGAVGTQFEAKWLRQKGSIDEQSLEVQDFSATTDLYSVTANVYAMREVPFSMKDLIGPIVIPAMLPFLPVALLAVPLKVIIHALAKLLF